MKTLFASTAYGFEELLKKELEDIGATACKITQGGVYFVADEKTCYQSLLWSRLASRIRLPIAEFDIYSDLDLYSATLNINWLDIFDVSRSFMIQFVGVNDFIRNSQYGALKIKDAIVDHFFKKLAQRPNIEKDQPDIRIHAYLHQHHIVLSLDLSGESLHQRGYRQQTGLAPLKENLAAAILLRSGWKQTEPLIDPMCGSGTLLIEAAMMAANIAPGLHRKTWGFTGWKEFNPTLWNDLFFSAKKNVRDIKPLFVGYDADAEIIEIAKMNAKIAGTSEYIHFQTQDISRLTNPFTNKNAGTIISNPPYGDRLGTEPALIALHTIMGQQVKSHFSGWQLSIISGTPSLLNYLHMRSDRQFKVKNGPIDCIQKNYTIATRNQDNPLVPAPLAAPDFANRLRKNYQKFSKWAKQEGLVCYRLYDADLPDYNVAIDCYKDKFVVQEYAAPKNIDPKKTRQRLSDIINVTLSVLNLNAEQLILKTREKQKGRQQYQQLAQQKSEFLVSEYAVGNKKTHFFVNMTDYLDTGLFLDHRLVRKMISEISANKDFLNLFAYTGSATVYAGLGKAKSTTTVDMSRTYLAWADRNLKQNGLTGKQHRLIQSDCLFYLAHCDDQFDLIFIDPPTFSNSKRMNDSFDIQRDHIALLASLKARLRPNGTIIFSNNKRGFKMDAAGMTSLQLSFNDITEKTLSYDFKRNKQIHSCFVIKHQ